VYYFNFNSIAKLPPIVRKKDVASHPTILIAVLTCNLKGDGHFF
jgi:hypothetical protein